MQLVFNNSKKIIYITNYIHSKKFSLSLNIAVKCVTTRPPIGTSRDAILKQSTQWNGTSASSTDIYKMVISTTAQKYRRIHNHFPISLQHNTFISWCLLHDDNTTPINSHKFYITERILDTTEIINALISSSLNSSQGSCKQFDACNLILAQKKSKLGDSDKHWCGIFLRQGHNLVWRWTMHNCGHKNHSSKKGSIRA